jgi:hypothetical protein
MGKLYNLSTGEQVELEDCVINNDELDILVNDKEFDRRLEEQYELEIVEKSLGIPEGVNPVEYIDKDLDSQMDEPMLDSFMESISNTTPEILPSCKTYEQWLVNKCVNPDWKDYFLDCSINEVDKYTDRPTRDEVIKPYDTEETRKEYSSYIKGYRKELREWWFKRNKSYIEIDGIMMSEDEYMKSIGRSKDIMNKRLNETIVKGDPNSLELFGVKDIINE